MVFVHDSPSEYCPAMLSIKDRRKELGMSQARLAELAGTSQPQIRRLENGERTLTKKWAERLAPHLQVAPQDLLFSDSGDNQWGVVGLPVLGTSRAGDWLDISIMDDCHEPETIQVAANPRYPTARQYALQVVGDSMDELLPDGCYAIVVDFAATGLAFRPGMIVHVEQHMSGTSLVETTIKQIGPDLKTLLPRSTNPVHKPIPLTGNAATEVVIKGIVTGKFEPFDF